MSVKDAPGRQISLDTLIDHERGIVQVLRRLHKARGCMTDSGNMGQMRIEEWAKFLDEQRVQVAKQPTLFERFGGVA